MKKEKIYTNAVGVALWVGLSLGLLLAGCGSGVGGPESGSAEEFGALGVGEEFVEEEPLDVDPFLSAPGDFGLLGPSEEAAWMGAMGVTRAAAEEENGAVAGRVVTVLDGEYQPLYRARVILVPPDGPTSDPSERWSAWTNRQGAYVIRDVPPGRYLAVAIKQGYEPHARAVAVEAGQITRAYFLLERLDKHLQGQGTLVAAGRGSALLTGEGVLLARTRRGPALLRVKGDLEQLVVHGKGQRVELPDGTIEYRGLRGQAFIRGQNLEVFLRNDFDYAPEALMQLTAFGRGEATLTGQGWYWTHGAKGPWVDSGVTVVYEDPIDEPEMP